MLNSKHQAVDTKTFGKVAVLFGGNSGEREVSLRSGEAVVEGLKEQSINVVGIDSSKDVIKQLSTGDFDRAFIALHGKGGEDGVIQGLLETMNIPYTGSGVMGSAIGMDKLRSKQIWEQSELPVIPSASLKAGQQITEIEASQLLVKFGNAVMVKPSAEGSSLGMTKAQTKEQLLEAIDKASEYGGEVLVEQWITGPEYTVSILKAEALPAVKIQPAREFYDYEAKYAQSGTEYFCPCGLSAEQENELKTMALQAFDTIGCTGWGRVDFIQNKSSGQFYLLEANTVPGLTETSLVPMSAKQAGYSFSQLVIDILTTSLTEQELTEEVASE